MLFMALTFPRCNKPSWLHDKMLKFQTRIEAIFPCTTPRNVASESPVTECGSKRLSFTGFFVQSTKVMWKGRKGSCWNWLQTTFLFPGIFFYYKLLPFFSSRFALRKECIIKQIFTSTLCLLKWKRSSRIALCLHVEDFTTGWRGGKKF